MCFQMPNRRIHEMGGRLVEDHFREVALSRLVDRWWTKRVTLITTEAIMSCKYLVLLKADAGI
jgi:hypothetical protein